jgi:ribosome biogenesis GTPase A
MKIHQKLIKKLRSSFNYSKNNNIEKLKTNFDTTINTLKKIDQFKDDIVLDEEEYMFDETLTPENVDLKKYWDNLLQAPKNFRRIVYQHLLNGLPLPSPRYDVDFVNPLLMSKAKEIYNRDTIEFYKSINDFDDLPRVLVPEIAFAGRSNVGKSSLINKTFGIDVAKTSSKPVNLNKIL